MKTGIERWLLQRGTMRNFKVASWLVTVASCSILVTAQNSQNRSSSTTKGPDPLKTATKPITPKSAMPAQHKSTAAAPATGVANTNASKELSHLERQPSRTPPAPEANASPKPAPLKSSNKSTAASPEAKFVYRKPAGGMQATTPDARTANSPTPRVKKN